MTSSATTGHQQGAIDPEDLEKPSLFLNRELSWLQFNLRVLEEAEDPRHPLLERVKFLAIFATNLDEFFMIMVSGLRRQVSSGAGESPPDAMTPSEQMLAICRDLTTHLERYQACWKQHILPKLGEVGIHVLHYAELDHVERNGLRQYFLREIFPTLTPLAIDPTHPFPLISNLSFNLAVVVKNPDRGECFARVKLPDVFRAITCKRGDCVQTEHMNGSNPRQVNRPSIPKNGFSIVGSPESNTEEHARVAS